MKTTLVAVTSINGKITRGLESDIYLWTSREDEDYFYSLVKKYPVVVMGNLTYQAIRNDLQLSKNTLRIVLTRNPQKYASNTIKGQLEFSSETPTNLVKRLSKNGYKKMLVVGGSTVNSLFLKSNLVDEIYLTQEPKIFGTGKNLIDDSPLEISLKLISLKKLNSTGTVLLKYLVKNRKGK